MAAFTFWVAAALIAWVYFGYPFLLVALGRRFSRPRRRAPVTPSISVICSAHNEEGFIAAKIANVLATDYPAECLQLIVASDGSTDGTVEAARGAGAEVVLNLPRVGKISAINRAVEEARGEILVFTDVDSHFEPDTLAELASNFADPDVGGVAANEVRNTSDGAGGVAHGEGLYWKYEQWIKRLEDALGSAVSASGRLYGIRRELFEPSATTAGTDDFVISTQVIKAGKRLAFDVHARVLVDSPEDARTELRRKVRVMNRGLRAAFSLGVVLVPFRGGLYAFEVFFHKILRRLVPFLLIAALLASFRLAADDPVWWIALGPQLLFYALAIVGGITRSTRWGRTRAVWVPQYFCLANAAAGLAVLSLLFGIRFEMWEPAAARGRSATVGSKG